MTKWNKFGAHDWQPRRWSWVDPEKDIKAAQLAIQTGVSSPQAIAAQYGMDLEDVIASIAAASAMIKEHDVSSIVNFGVTKGGTNAQGNQTGDK